MVFKNLIPCFFCLVLTAGLFAPGSLSAETIVFRNVDILDIENRDLFPDQTVTVENGVITGISGDPGPDEGIIVKGEGLTLMPGLVDMHVHLEWFPSTEILPLFLLNGVTMVRQMDGRPEHIEWRDQIAAGELTGPFIYVGGKILEGPDPQWDDTRVVTTVEEARAAVRDQKEQGYDFIKVYHTLTPEMYWAILTEAENLNMQVAGHVPSDLELDEALSGGQETIEHLTGFFKFIRKDGADPHPDLERRVNSYFAAEIDLEKQQALVRAIADSKIAVTPTVSIQREFFRALPVEEPEVPFPHLFTEDVMGFWYGVHGWLRDEFGPEAMQAADDGLKSKQALVEGLFDAGVPLFIGTDTPQPFLVPGLSVHQEMASFVEAGIPPEEVLAIVIQNPDRFIRDYPGNGTIAVGKTANFILVEGNPLQDLAALKNVKGTMVGQAWNSREEILRLLEVKGEKGE